MLPGSSLPTVYGDGVGGNLVLREDFEADELMPEITPSASRRLADIARLVVESSRAEHLVGEGEAT